MTTLEKRFFTLTEFNAIGGPARVPCYNLAHKGLLELSKDIAGRTGVTAAEADRYFASVQLLSDVTKRDTSNGVAARIEQAQALKEGSGYKDRAYDSRGHRAA